MIRFFFRWAFRFLVLAVVLFTGLILTKDVILREWMVYRLGRVTGLETRLGDLRTAWLSGSASLNDLKLFNTAEFGGGPLLSVPDLHVELDLSALWRRQLRLKLGRVHLAEFNIVQNQRGETNLIRLLETVQERATAMDAAAAGPPGFEFGGIETLNLTVGTVRFLHVAQPSADRTINVGITNEVLREVHSASDFAPLLLRVVVKQLTQEPSLRPRKPSPQADTQPRSGNAPPRR